ncbi:hypothetical protein SELMODRAFT_430402 [Selaginella moellendorffii]|uniref:Uncharacterized protein n=1 Tax=Selaginella moellendorffii TaxID=88036 RepID=D8T9B0_SELML|nr:hypothetical protein SELMODRAFT_430402 [Selaginella moellendorffii]
MRRIFPPPVVPNPVSSPPRPAPAMAAEQRPPSERGLPGPGPLRQPLRQPPSPATHGSVSRPVQPRPTTSHRQEQPVSTPPRPTPSPRTRRTPPHTSMPERPSTPRSPEAGPPPLTPRASPAQRAPSTRTTRTQASPRAASQELRRPPPAPVDPPVAPPPRDHPAAQRTRTDAEAIPPQPERCSGQPAPGRTPEPPAAPPPPLATGAEDGYTLGGFKNIDGAFNSILASSLREFLQEYNTLVSSRSALQGLKDLKEQKKRPQSLRTRPPKLKVSRHAQDGLTSRIAEAHERYLTELHDILIKAREDEIETLQRLVSSGLRDLFRSRLEDLVTSTLSYCSATEHDAVYHHLLALKQRCTLKFHTETSFFMAGKGIEHRAQTTATRRLEEAIDAANASADALPKEQTMAELVNAAVTKALQSQRHATPSNAGKKKRKREKKNKAREQRDGTPGGLRAGHLQPGLVPAKRVLDAMALTVLAAAAPHRGAHAPRHRHRSPQVPSDLEDVHRPEAARELAHAALDLALDGARPLPAAGAGPQHHDAALARAHVRQPPKSP